MNSSTAHSPEIALPGCCYDLKNPDTYVDGIPYELFAVLRNTDPVYWNPETDGAGFWAVTRYEDIVTVSKNAALFSSAFENGGHRIFNENEVGLAGAGDSAIGIPLISRDPPHHNQYRKFIMPALSPVRIEGIESRITERAEALLAKIPLNETVDILPAFTVPLPLLTLAELLGVPMDSWPDLHRWTDAFIGEDDPELRQSPEAMATLLGEFFGFAQELFERRRAEPSGDIASLLANTQINGELVPCSEFIGNLILALVGGNETTRNSLNHSMIAFANNPGEWTKLRNDTDLMPSAVKEMVRCASPVVHMRRTAMEDTTLGGKTIRKGDKVVVFYPSANRDESVFAEPNRFDISRVAKQHLGFGFGTHVCMGSRLAEMQLRVAFRLIARQVRGFEIQSARRVRSNFINGFKSLEVRLLA